MNGADCEPNVIAAPSEPTNINAVSEELDASDATYKSAISAVESEPKVIAAPLEPTNNDAVSELNASDAAYKQDINAVEPEPKAISAPFEPASHNDSVSEPEAVASVLLPEIEEESKGPGR